MEYRNAKFIANDRIDCEINHSVHGWIPFTIDKNDKEAKIDVVQLYNTIISAGNVEPYVEPTAEELAIQADVEARQYRRSLLETAVDPLVTNPLRWADMSVEEQERIKIYRQALLDITDQVGYPSNIEWPIY
jgi:hypothetical protein